MTPWLVVIAAGALTYVIRLSLMVLVRHTALPTAGRTALSYATPAVLAAIILPAVLYAGTPAAFDATPGNPRIAAAALAAVIAYATRNTWATIVAGMCALWLLTWAG
ncbi:MAG: AzlD domain-containing protein [Chloroflexi bacterium]|nr:AzlD domain-containing protein [Chloroflexota bacterium]